MKHLYRINIEKSLNMFNDLGPPYKFESNLEYKFVIADSDEKVEEYIKEIYKEEGIWRVSYCRCVGNIIEL